MTNREKLNEMSNREIALLLVENDCACNLCAYRDLEDCGGCGCVQGYEKWLESEAEQ